MVNADATEGAHVHNVTLIGKDKSQDAFLVLDAAGLAICRRGSQPKADLNDVIANIAFQFVYKLCKACKRSRNAGTAKMLDVVINSNRGLRELRLDLGSASKVEQVMQEFRSMVSAYMAATPSRAAAHPTNAPILSPAGSFLQTQAQTAHFARTASTSPSPRGPGGHATFSERSGSPYSHAADASPRTWPLPGSHFAPHATGGVHFPPAHAGLPAAGGTTPKGQWSGGGTATWHADATGVGGGAARDQQHVEFLESLVTRLSTQLAEAQQRARSRPASPDRAATPVAAASTSAPLSPPPRPPPPWLTDPDTVNPLLLAYDAKVERLEAELDAQRGAVETFQKQVEEGVDDAARLQDELRNAMAHASEASQGTAARPASPTSYERERLALLRRENGLLTEHNAALDGEVARLAAERDDALARRAEAAADAARGDASLRAKVAETDELSSSLRALHAQTGALERKVADAGEARAAAHEAAQEAAMLRERCAELEEHLAAAESAAQDADADAAAQHADADAAHDAARSEAARADAAEHAAAELRVVLATAQARCAELAERDTDAYSRVRAASEAAEQAKLDSDAATVRQRQLEAEVATLRDQVAAAASSAGSRAPEDTDAMPASAGAQDVRRDLTRTRRELATLEDTVVDLRAACARLEREKRALREQLDNGTTDAGQSAAAAKAMQRALAAEHARDAAREDAAAAERAAARARKEADVALRAANADGETAANAAEAARAAAAAAKAESAALARQLAGAKRAAEHGQEARERRAEDARGAADRARAERASEVQMLAAKLEDAMTAYNRSVADAERLIAHKNALLQRYKAEAQAAAGKVSSLQADLEEQTCALTHARDAAAAAAQDAEVLRAELDAARAEADAGRAAADDLDAAVDEAAAARARSEEEARRRRAAEAALERAQLDAARAARRSASAHAHDVARVLTPAAVC